jgi:hypothetical protein
MSANTLIGLDILMEGMCLAKEWLADLSEF